MNALRSFAGVLIISALLLPAASCVVTVKKDNGKHKGWYKNPNNPHNPAHDVAGKNAGKGNTNKVSNGKGNSKSKGK